MEYYFNIGGKQRGPLDLAEFRELVKNKAISADDYVWDAKQGKWVKIKLHGELGQALDEETALAAAEDEGFFINVEGKTGGPFPRDAIIKEIERGRFKGAHFVWDGTANRWLKAAEHPLFSQFFTPGTKTVATKKYYLSKEGSRYGPFDFAEAEEKIMAGEFDRGHFIWEHRLKKWVKLGDVADFADVFADIEAREPVVPPPMTTEPPPPVAAGPKAPGPAGIKAPVRVPAEPAAVTILPDVSAPAPAPGPSVVPGPPIAPAAPRPATPLGPPTAPAGVASPFGASLPPLSPAARPPGPPPAAPPRPEPKVGDLVNISIPEAPAAKPAAEPPKVTVEQVEFKRVGEEPPVRGSGAGLKIDRSVVLDYSRPSTLSRIAAQLVDLGLISLSYFLVALIFSFLDMNAFMPGPDQYYYRQLFWATLAGVGIFYFLVRDAGGASFGKKIMGLRVVKYNDFNRRANLVHSIVRNITLLIPLVNILELVYVFTDLKGRRMGDRAAGTVLTEATEIDYVRQQQGILDEVY